jgi:Mor family transcriptional regulator
MASVSEWYRQRDAEIVRRCDAGEDAGVLAREHNLTRVRILQIVREAHPPDAWERRAAQRRAEAVEALRRWDAGETYAEIAEAMVLSKHVVMSAVNHLKYLRASEDNKFFWNREFSDSERVVLRDLLLEAKRGQDWDAVKTALDILYDGAHASSRRGYKRQGVGRGANSDGEPSGADEGGAAADRV